MEREDLERIAEVLKDTDIIVISDEIYSELTYCESPHVSPASVPNMWERTITINGFSKAYSMTGWRLGYACGPEEIMKQITKIHQYAIMCAPTTSQYAAVFLCLQLTFSDAPSCGGASFLPVSGFPTA